ncbi:AzlC family ABC transporter permease [Reinekea marinisedimentorum]|uniref:4-azaleucine resistance transporter AzlC n=1 Tax=Reinekea marinisedimentorum TaxID=230495 RepID=A0A4R3I361_9GAMM|nr:AzlC family ABC transporter permease [Reinekea marinisedimentorum]TCS40228.1 4-azaleucine resistance transporter AzlC [Reinekea marinisedimentorum]
MQNPNTTPAKKLLKGVVVALPISLAVIPWGVLAGSYAIDAGLNVVEAQMMSGILFAGSAQLVAAGMFKSGVAFATMMLTVLIITSRHFLYGISMRQKISKLPKRWRLLLGFLLTDELFAVCGSQKDAEFDRWYALGVGGSFYVVWNIASAAGIFLGSQIPWLNNVGLEFVVAATFIALVVPHITTLPVVLSVIVALVLSVVLGLYQVPGSLLIAALSGMTTGFIAETWQSKRARATRFSEEKA